MRDGVERIVELLADLGSRCGGLSTVLVFLAKVQAWVRDDPCCADLVQDKLSWSLDLLEVVAGALINFATEVPAAQES